MKDRLQVMLIVGDAMGLPLVDEMARRQGEVDLSSLFSITSGGALWSTSVRDRMVAVKSDDTIVFLGRGSQCINTGGEKVFAKEVEAALHAHPSIVDALVVPVPDERLGHCRGRDRDLSWLGPAGPRLRSGTLP